MLRVQCPLQPGAIEVLAHVQVAVGLLVEAAGDDGVRGQRGQVLALRVMGNYFGQSVSPVVFGLLGSLIGLAPVFWISGSILALSAGLTRQAKTQKAL